jgi:hypothetical protein
MDYPDGFARRFLEQAAKYGHAWANVDLDAGEIDYVNTLDDASDPEVSDANARVQITDSEIEPAWEDLIGEARSFYPSLPIEQGVYALLSVIIEETLLTNYLPPPRVFTIGQILRPH